MKSIQNLTRRLSVSASTIAAAASLPSAMQACMPNVEAERARDEADRYRLSMEDVRVADHLLILLQEVNRFVELRTHGCGTLFAAIYRYEKCWLPLLASQPTMDLFPPLDVAWVWYCHRMNPRAYKADCEALFDRLLDFRIPPNIAQAMQMTAVIWRELYPADPFEVNTAWSSPEFKSSLSVDLSLAAVHHGEFWHQVSLEHFHHPKYLKAAVQRYKRFLLLLRRNNAKIFLVPSPDIELIWRAHMMCPIAYHRDTFAIVGSFFDKESLLQFDTTVTDVTEATASIWKETFDEIYFLAGANYRGDPDVINVRADLVRNIGYYYLLNPDLRDAKADINGEKYGLKSRDAFSVVLHLKFVQALHHTEKHEGEFCYLNVEPVPSTDVGKQTDKVPVDNPFFNKIFFLTADNNSEGVSIAIKRCRAMRKDAKIASANINWNTLLANNDVNLTLRLPLEKRGEQRGFLHVFTSCTPSAKLGASVRFENLGPSYIEGGKAINWIARAHDSTPVFAVSFSFPASRTMPRTITVSHQKAPCYNINQDGDRSTIISGVGPNRVRARLTCVNVTANRVRCDFELLPLTADTQQPLISIQFGRRLEFAKRASGNAELRVYTIVQHAPHNPYGSAVALFSLGAAPFVEVVPTFDLGLAIAVHAAATLLTSHLCIPVSKLYPFERSAIDVSPKQRRIYDDDGVAATGALWLTMYAASGIGDTVFTAGLMGVEGILDLGGALEGIGLGELFAVF